ncbi:MAG: hypothetical protein Q8R92_21245 [Deltaproteobacteria bacterium]|nr:hypothetical protein [Deltaproteobacteria bacterium]
MADDELIAFAKEFRDGILDGNPPWMMCAAVCWPLAGLLRFHGIECECIESDLGEFNHIWICLADGRALDPTGDQFNDYGFTPMPPVYLGEPLPMHPTPESG